MKLEIIKDFNYRETLIKIFTPTIDRQTKAIIDFITEKPEVLYGYKNKKLEFIKREEIIRIFTANKQVLIETASDTYLSKRRLYELEERLAPDFIRISQGELINIKFIRRLDLTIRGSIKVMLKNGTVSFVSRRNLKQFKEKLNI